jgi:hypothetical protein
VDLVKASHLIADLTRQSIVVSKTDHRVTVLSRRPGDDGVAIGSD